MGVMTIEFLARRPEDDVCDGWYRTERPVWSLIVHRWAQNHRAGYVIEAVAIDGKLCDSRAVARLNFWVEAMHWGTWQSRMRGGLYGDDWALEEIVVHRILRNWGLG